MQGVPLLVTPQDALEKRPRDPAIYQDFDTGPERQFSQRQQPHSVRRNGASRRQAKTGDRLDHMTIETI